ncbi:unnamed protein product, partial [Prorocentrum cordatum]
MPSQLVLSVPERASPGPSRGWRTPEPLPAPASNGLLHGGVPSFEMAHIPEIPDEDARDSSPEPLDAAVAKQGSSGRDLRLMLRIYDHELMDASTPRGHDQEARKTPPAADALPAAAQVGATPDAAWARIRTPSPDHRTYAPHAPLAWPQGMPELKPPQWILFDPIWGASTSAARAGACGRRGATRPRACPRVQGRRGEAERSRHRQAARACQATSARGCSASARWATRTRARSLASLCARAAGARTGRTATAATSASGTATRPAGRRARSGECSCTRPLSVRGATACRRGRAGRCGGTPPRSHPAPGRLPRSHGGGPPTPPPPPPPPPP